MPGSHIQILPPSALEAKRPDYLLILPWNIADEVQRQLAGLAAQGTRFVTAVPEVRAALAVLDTLAARDAEGRDVLARNREAAARFDDLTAPLRAHPRVKAHRRIGMIWAWDIDVAEPTFAARYHRAAMDAGLLLRPIGATLYVMPPYVLTPADQSFLAEGLLRVLDQVLSECDALPEAGAATVPVP